MGLCTIRMNFKEWNKREVLELNIMFVYCKLKKHCKTNARPISLNKNCIDSAASLKFHDTREHESLCIVNRSGQYFNYSLSRG